jgi:hypothetical protein
MVGSLLTRPGAKKASSDISSRDRVVPFLWWSAASASLAQAILWANDHYLRPRASNRGRDLVNCIKRPSL